MPTSQVFCRHLAAAENAAGSAARATCWLLLEQAGSWGKKAATESDLDPRVGSKLDALATACGGRFGLIRVPNQRAHEQAGRPTVLVAGNLTGEAWLVRGQVAAARELLGLDAAMLTATTPAALLAAFPTFQVSTPVALVCTNGKRDVCCAVAGRPLANQAARLARGQVFETSHTGGHRFAPTGVLLPSGLTFARLDAPELIAALHAASDGVQHPALCDMHTNRGMCALQPYEQAALVALQTTLCPPVALGGWQVESTPAGDDWLVRIRGNGTCALLRMRRQVLAGFTRPASCGADAKPVAVWQPVSGDFPAK